MGLRAGDEQSVEGLCVQGRRMSAAVALAISRAGLWRPCRRSTNSIHSAGGRWENVQRVLALVYLVACPFIAGLLGILAALPPWRISNLVSAGVAACYLALGFLDARVHRGLFVAKELSKREDEKEDTLEG